MRIKSFFSREAFGPVIEKEPEGPDCPSCKLYLSARSPKMKWSGEGKLNCLIIAEAPGEEEDNLGKQLRGTIGRNFSLRLKKRGLNLDRDFFLTNAINCRPMDNKGNNRKPIAKEIQCCKPLVDKYIKEINPDYIWLLGDAAVNSYFTNRFKTRMVNRWRNLCIPDRKHNAWVMPMYHPSWAVRKVSDPAVKAFYERDLDDAVNWLRTLKPITDDTFPDEKQYVTRLTDFDSIASLLRSTLTDKPNIFFDYETTSLKPYKPENRIASISFSPDYDRAYAFPYQYRDMWSKDQFREIKKLWMNILKDPNIGLKAQNLQFEDMWSRGIVGVEPRGWQWCTMVTSHVLDARKNYTGLKFQVFIRFGLDGYDKAIQPYLIPLPGQELNRVMEADLDDLLMYNGLDSLFGQRLWELQYKQLDTQAGLRRANHFFRESTITLSKIHANGITVDEDYYNRVDKEIDEDLKRLEDALWASKENQKFRRKYNRDIDLNSGDDMRLLFSILDLNITKKTATELVSVDAEVMEGINTPFTRNLLLYRKKSKVKSTYFGQFLRESYNGKMHANFSLHKPRSYRSSSDHPNFQNIPFRDEEAKRLCRSGIIPSPGNQLLEVDYGSMEVRIGACYTKDQTLIKYINSPGTDLHHDSAADIFHLNTHQNTKSIRFYAKNQWVFPQFYGSYYKTCAGNLWQTAQDESTAEGQKLRDHLFEVGICKNRDRAYDEFELHCKEVEDGFWGRFRGWKKWQDNMLKFYTNYGYVELMHGFRRGGFLARNKIFNTPIQGTAFHCLMWTLNRMCDEWEQDRWLSKVIGQIHDSIVIDTHPSETEYILRRIKQIGTEDIRKSHDWIIVPLVIEAELTPINGSWYSKEEIDSKGYGMSSKQLLTQREISW